MKGALTAVLAPVDARALTDRIKVGVEAVWELIKQAYTQRAWSALGYSSWDDYCTREFGTARLRLPREERAEVVSSLRDSGLSLRAIAAATGISHEEARRSLPPVTNVTPDPEVAEDALAEELIAAEPPGGLTDESPGQTDRVAEALARARGAAKPAEPAPVIGVDGKRYPRTAHVRHQSGDCQWFTPAEIVGAAIAVMGGIDLDPASCAAANGVVGAAAFYTAEEDGLTRPWAGRVWMNPPYGQPFVARFCERLAIEYMRGAVSAACVLVNNATETVWFQALASEASALCFPRGRIKFWHPNKTSATPLQGQTVLYLGDDTAAFKREFLRFGFVAVMR